MWRPSQTYCPEKFWEIIRSSHHVFLIRFRRNLALCYKAASNVVCAKTRWVSASPSFMCVVGPWLFYFNNLLTTQVVKAWLRLLIFWAECKAHLFASSFYFNKCQLLLPLWYLLIQCHYFVFVLYGDIYHKECKGNNLCTKGMSLLIRINYF